MRTIVCFAALMFCGIRAAALDVELTWEHPQYSDGTRAEGVIGYNIYYGTQTGSYSNTVSVGIVYTYLSQGLKDGTTYYFALSARYADGVESELTDEVVLPEPPDGDGAEIDSKDGTAVLTPPEDAAPGSPLSLHVIE